MLCFAIVIYVFIETNLIYVFMTAVLEGLIQ